MNMIHVGDYDFIVEESPKKIENERPPREEREATDRCQEES
jgi:hypothetical protein